MLERRPEFPGMDPWLEHPTFWPGVHTRLIAAIADALVPLVDPRYFVGVEVRTMMVNLSEAGRPARPDLTITARAGTSTDPTAAPSAAGVAVLEQEVELPADLDEIEEASIEIRELPGHRLVTVVEILSPTNKESVGRLAYLEKRTRLLASRVNLVEIDLLRGGQPMPLRESNPPGDYRILVGRGHRRPKATLLTFSCRSPIPEVPIPLLPADPEPRLDLNAVLHALADRGRFFRGIDYHKPPVPPLSPEDADWAAGIIGRARLD